MKSPIAGTADTDMFTIAATATHSPLYCLREKSGDLLIGVESSLIRIFDLSITTGDQTLRSMTLTHGTGAYNRHGGDQSDVEAKNTLIGSQDAKKFLMIDLINATPQVTGSGSSVNGLGGLMSNGIKAIPDLDAFWVSSIDETGSDLSSTFYYLNAAEETFGNADTVLNFVDKSSELTGLTSNYVISSIDATSSTSVENPGTLLISGYNEADDKTFIISFKWEDQMECEATCAVGKCTVENDASKCTECLDSANYQPNPATGGGTCELICDSSCAQGKCTTAKDAAKCTECQDSANFLPNPATGGGTCEPICDDSCATGKCTAPKDASKCTECKDSANYLPNPATGGST